ncbi:MAG TPA: F0F1 ATP synthase subunit A [Candidatus Saccharimonadales bacterium]|nr:F0F1 ATP synthase subunit A [Candidatus Saccharimonadales bacterium]
MLGLVSSFAASTPNVHIAPGPVLKIGSFVVTNSMLYGWIIIVCSIVFFIWVAKRITVKPQGGIIQYVEAIAEYIINTVQDAFDDPALGRKFVPYFLTLFFFILFNNLSELIPISGDGIHAGSLPLLKPFTADLDATVAMGIVTMSMVYFYSVKLSGGFRKYVRHFFVGNPLNPLYFFIGLLEMFSDAIRVISLSLRLFLNVTIGEMIIVVFSWLGHFLAPVTALPFELLELLVCFIQAYIFTLLGTMYLAIAVNAAGHHTDGDDLTEGPFPETIKATAAAAKGEL